LWFCLLSSSVCRIPSRIFCCGGWVVMYCFSFCLLWKILIAPSILNDSLSQCVILGLKLFSFSAWNTSLHALLVFNVSIEKSIVSLMGWPLYIIYFFSFTALNMLSLLSVLVNLMMICCGKVLFLSSLFGVLEASCTWMVKTFLRFGTFYFIEYIIYPFVL
jgi:hypothetical protein